MHASAPCEQLDHCLDRFVTAALAGDDAAARTAFADAQALPALADAHREATAWAAQERAMWNLLPDDQLDGTPSRVTAALTPSPPPSCPVTALGIAFALGEAAAALLRTGQRLPGTATGSMQFEGG